MSHEIHPIEFHDPATHVPQPGDYLVAECEMAETPIRRWLKRVASALARAERRITENFRVPPGGG